MGNVLKVSIQTSIYGLAERGWSTRRIARELGIDRETVGRYLRLAKPANSITGASGGRKSCCAAFTELIGTKLQEGLSARRIYQDLVEQNAFPASYQSVQRFVAKLKTLEPRVW